MRARWCVVAVLVSVLQVFAGCDGGLSADCRKMRACCAAVEGMEGLGEACGDLALQTRKAETCRVVIETVGHMRAERELPLPEACRLGGDEGAPAPTR